MKITPIDIQQVGFKVHFRGYNRQEVDTFLDTVSEDYESVIKENHDLRDRMTDLETQLAALKQKEASLNSTLVKAQGLVEQMQQNAYKEAQLITKEAEINAMALVKTAHQKVANVQGEILDLQKQKVIFIEKIQSLIRTFQKVVQSIEEQERDLLDQERSEGELVEDKQGDNLRVLRPKP